MQTADIVVIGAGVVGLAVAAELAGSRAGRAVVLLERHEGFGRETSSRNSEVIHAGIYYDGGSLKARLCVEGSALLYDFCRRHDVPHRRCGKLIVAGSPDEEETLGELLARGRANGVPGLELLDRAQVRAREPNVAATAALWSPSTGIVDSHRLMARLEQSAAAAGVVLAYRHAVEGLEHAAGGYDVLFSGPGGLQDRLRSRWVVNCAGLGSEQVAAMAGIDTAAAGYRLHLCKGEYFTIPPSKARLVEHLVYPPPYRDLRGLGIHVTLSLDGRVRLGPNAFYVDGLDYDVDPGHAGEFFDGVRDYLPFLEHGDLRPDTAGIRPKLQAPGTPARDFVVCHEQARGLPGFINLIGIESPGLTSCLAIARMVAGMIEL